MPTLTTCPGCGLKLPKIETDVAALPTGRQAPYNASAELISLDKVPA